MRILIIGILLVCASLLSGAQTNYVKNGDFERYDTCPYELDQLRLSKFWRPPVDSLWSHPGEYNNSCADAFADRICHVPDNTAFYQYAHSGNGFIALVLYYDKTLPPPPKIYGYPFNYRDYAQVRLYKTLSAGSTYCVSFWVNKTESYCYAHNKIGAYLDDGRINTAVDSAGKEITSVLPQVYTNTIVRDTQNWVKIEGSFVASGNETVLTIGNFFPNSAVDTTSADCSPGGLPQYSYYLFDDVSVVPIDAKANAGPDRWVELGATTQIGPVEDSTARGMDCKWYYKGKLADSGNVIRVSANAVKYAVDTYVVVQNVCGTITRDTMLLRTVGLGVSHSDMAPVFVVHPNPGRGSFIITGRQETGLKVNARIYDVLGRVVYNQQLFFSGSEHAIDLDTGRGVYLLELTDGEGKVWRQQIVIE